MLNSMVTKVFGFGAKIVKILINSQTLPVELIIFCDGNKAWCKSKKIIWL